MGDVRSGTRMSSSRAQEFDDRFAANLTAARKRAGLTRDQLGDRAGMSVHQVRSIEQPSPGNARRRVSIGEAVILAAALGMQPGELLRRVPDA